MLVPIRVTLSGTTGNQATGDSDGPDGRTAGWPDFRGRRDGPDDRTAGEAGRPDLRVSDLRAADLQGEPVAVWGKLVRMVNKKDALHHVREICLALPEVIERLSHGSPTFFVRGKKTFVTFLDNHHGDGRLAIWCHAAPGVQAVLVEEEPDRFFVPAYVGHRGWIGVRLDRDVDWDEIAQIAEDAYRMVAPKQLLAQLDPPD
jgi:hypothetical protein